MGVDAQMLVKVQGELTKDEVRKISTEMVEALYKDTFWIERDRDQHALAIVDEYEQDGESIFPEEGETLVDVNLISRYYGKGYERGPLQDFIIIAEYLERKIPNSEVYYGGDSSGVTATPFDKQARWELFDYFVENGHRPYRGYFQDKRDDVPYCDFCQHSLTQYGFGGNGQYAGFSCDSCGYKQITRDNGKTWSEEDER